ncbi:hypothetical protein AB4486_09800 [Vibrio sp. 10N.222.55.C6]|uniref:hypothetical protein n=1 Tax=Vibrio sp. 10N.222.55.C6 TaxID=3229649 RepID=UPI00354BAFAE
MKKIYLASFTLISILIGSIYIAVHYYLQTFPGGFSQEHSDWGNFGSYFNGVITPLISAFSLIAVLFTIYMQKNLLMSQQEQNAAIFSDRKKLEYINIVQKKIESIKIDIDVRSNVLELEKQVNRYSDCITKEDNLEKNAHILNQFTHEVAERNGLIKKHLNLIVWIHTIPDSDVMDEKQEFVRRLKELNKKEEAINKTYA